MNINSKILIKIILIFICLVIICNAFYGGDCGCCCDCCCDCCCCTPMLAIPCCCSYNSFGCYGGAIYGRRRRRSLQNGLQFKRCTNELIKNKKCTKRFAMEMVERVQVQPGQRPKRDIESNQHKLDFLKKLINKF